MNKSPLMWIIFITVVVILLILDLGILNKKNTEITFKKSLWMSAFYILIAFIFGIWIWYELGIDKFAEYITGFLVEKSLALDNIFLISLIFSALSIPLKYQHRVLFWGIIGVLIFRAIMIGIGAHIVNQFNWVLYIFAIIMIVTGIKIFFVSNQNIDMKNNLILKWLKKYLNITTKLHNNKFYIHQIDSVTNKKKIFFTPLFISLLMIEIIDLIFAIDSIPAIFAITQDPYIVYTSNIFAILGLRALYFALGTIIDRFYYLKYALAFILIFIGGKIFIADLLEIEKIPATFSLGVTSATLIIGILYSVFKNSHSKIKLK